MTVEETIGLVAEALKNFNVAQADLDETAVQYERSLQQAMSEIRHSHKELVKESLAQARTHSLSVIEIQRSPFAGLRAIDCHPSSSPGEHRRQSMGRLTCFSKSSMNSNMAIIPYTIFRTDVVTPPPMTNYLTVQSNVHNRNKKPHNDVLYLDEGFEQADDAFFELKARTLQERVISVHATDVEERLRAWLPWLTKIAQAPPNACNPTTSLLAKSARAVALLKAIGMTVANDMRQTTSKELCRAFDWLAERWATRRPKSCKSTSAGLISTCAICKIHQCSRHDIATEFGSTPGRVYTGNLDILYGHSPADLYGLGANGHLEGTQHTPQQQSELPLTDYETCGPRCCWKKSNRKSTFQRWTQDERAILQTVRSMYEADRRGPCILARMSVLTKSCAEIYWRLHRSKSEQAPNRPFQDNPRPPSLENSIERWIKRQHASYTHKHDERTPFRPCHHVGPCRKGICSCRDSKVTCEKTCACDETCPRRYTGCNCTASKRTCADSSSCPCQALNRECDPDLCRHCGAFETLDPSNRNDDSNSQNLAWCCNVEIQRSWPKPTILGSSQLLQSRDPPLHEFGLYAAVVLWQMDFLGEYCGEILENDEADERGLVYDRMGLSYLFTLNASQVVDSTYMGNKMRFMNDPGPRGKANVEARILFCNCVQRIGMFAMRKINAGEELLLEYGDGFWDKISLAIESGNGTTSGRLSSQKQATLLHEHQNGHIARKAPVSTSRPRQLDSEDSIGLKIGNSTRDKGVKERRILLENSDNDDGTDLSDTSSSTAVITNNVAHGRYPLTHSGASSPSRFQNSASEPVRKRHLPLVSSDSELDEDVQDTRHKPGKGTAYSSHDHSKRRRTSRDEQAESRLCLISSDESDDSRLSDINTDSSSSISIRQNERRSDSESNSDSHASDSKQDRQDLPYIDGAESLCLPDENEYVDDVDDDHDGSD